MSISTSHPGFAQYQKDYALVYGKVGALAALEDAVAQAIAEQMNHVHQMAEALRQEVQS